MALRLWLQMNGDDVNSGISGTVMTTSGNVWGNAEHSPIGKCAVFSGDLSQCVSEVTSGTGDYCYTSDQYFTCSFWIRHNYSAKTADYMYVFSVGRLNGSGRGFGCRLLNSSNLRFHYGTSTFDLSGVTENVWHHVAFVYSAGTITLYLDGQVKRTATFSGTAPTFAQSKGLKIGGHGYSSTYANPMVGALCDFRLYDHALYEKEIASISRALKLFLKMDGRYMARGINIDPDAWYADSSQNVGANYKILHSSADFYGIQVGETVTYSVYIKAPSTKRIRAMVQFYTSSSSRTSVNSTEIIPAGGEGYSSVTFTLTEARRAYNRIDLMITNVDTSVTETTAVYVSKVKLERGVTRTEWSAYAETPDLFVDSSGFVVPVIASATPPGSAIIPMTDIPVGPCRLGCAAYFTGVSGASRNYLKVPDSIIQANSVTYDGGADFTIAMWFNPSTLTGPQFLWDSAYNNPSGNIDRVAIYLSGTQEGWIYIARQRFGDLNVSAGITANTWHHIACVFKTSGTYGSSSSSYPTCVLSVYINGVKLTETEPFEMDKFTFDNRTFATIGCRERTNDTDTDGFFKGCITDVRVYGTALSDYAVSSIYSHEMLIARDGTVFTRMLGVGENQSVSVGKHGVLGCSSVSESGGTPCSVKFKNDGTVVARSVDEINI